MKSADAWRVYRGELATRGSGKLTQARAKLAQQVRVRALKLRSRDHSFSQNVGCSFEGSGSSKSTS